MAITSRQKELRELLDRCEQLEVQIATDKARIQAVLAEAEKPKLRHGDYGTAIYKGEKFDWHCDGSGQGALCLASYTNISTHISWFRPQSVTDICVLGNAPDNIKAMSEPLKKFTMKETSAAAEFSGTINKWTVHLENYCHGTGVDIGIKDIPAFIRNLQRLVHTAGKEKNG